MSVTSISIGFTNELDIKKILLGITLSFSLLLIYFILRKSKIFANIKNNNIQNKKSHFLFAFYLLSLLSIISISLTIAAMKMIKWQK
ncbi:hypothetical protein [Mesobacillus boroniphilus]|uniref:hypothetical protein n=1 Tax=Mesobacillus boroniphilus TaxID=308892 RepID=UPI000554F26C|nr:hypothetical protein [Mesobacillus boroniphilus]